MSQLLKLPCIPIEDIKVNKPYLYVVYGEDESVSFRVAVLYPDALCIVKDGGYFNRHADNVAKIVYELPTNLNELLGAI
jgi:hypothetical protein